MFSVSYDNISDKVKSIPFILYFTLRCCGQIKIEKKISISKLNYMMMHSNGSNLSGFERKT